ncbi:MAG: GerA spore germination protein [Clostridiaceae bacterium]|jgi:spore germination protein KA|nr:GerA spore germination protein [Clostridiaceae bacterium]
MDKNNSSIQNNTPLSESISENLNMLHKLLSNCNDIVYREFVIKELNRSAAIVFINELIDTKLVNESIMPSLMNIREIHYLNLTSEDVMSTAKKYSVQFAHIEDISTIGQVIEALLNGNTVFLVDGNHSALKMETPGFKVRVITEPSIEKNIRGPKEGFTENININESLIRRKIKSPQLKFEEYSIGTLTQTKVFISYIEDVANPDIVHELKKRIESIDVDSILESGYIEELIEDTSFTLFPQIQHTERPDKAAAAILEGRAAVLVDGTPFVLLAPCTLIQFFQSCDDYYERYPAAIAIRFIRYIFSMLALFLPGLYVAIILYHKEMIPTPLLISIVGSAHRVPFPMFVEVLIMEITFEALREAGIRLPGPANQTVGIVGVLVIGDSAVRAGVVSPIMVIIVALTAISSFGLPSYDIGYTIRILRFIILVLGSILGLYGIMLGILILLIHLVSLRSFGVEYLSPLAPLNLKDLKDVLIRVPWWFMEERPSSTAFHNKKRQKSFLKPNILYKTRKYKRG